MDRAFVISGIAREGKELRPIAGVFFSNSAPDIQTLNRLGLYDVQSCEEVKPLSRQPNEPTLYMYARSPAPGSVEAIRFDWSNNVVNRVGISGEPSALVPPVSGAAADRLLYSTKAYVICANMKEFGRSKPVVAVLFIKPQPGSKCLQPDKKTLNRLGLVDIQSVERVTTSEQLPHSILYVLERTPAAKGVTVSMLGRDASVERTEMVAGEPHTVIPPISGSAADRFINPRNGLRKSDFPDNGGRQSGMPADGKRQSSMPPDGRRRSSIPPAPPIAERPAPAALKRGVSAAGASALKNNPQR